MRAVVIMEKRRVIDVKLCIGFVFIGCLLIFFLALLRLRQIQSACRFVERSLFVVSTRTLTGDVSAHAIEAVLSEC